MISPVNAKIITGGIEVSVEQARENAFEDFKANNKFSVERDFLIDRNRNENISMLLKGTTELKDRILALFSDGTYGVVYKENPTSVYYYSNQGMLSHKEVKSSLTYPYKTYKYAVTGKLTNVSLRLSDSEAFIFDAEGELIAHWVGSYCYDELGNVIMRRKIYK